MRKKMIVEGCGQVCCPDFKLLPCRREYDLKAAYCAYRHPFVMLPDEWLGDFPEFCPLEDNEPQAEKEEVSDGSQVFKSSGKLVLHLDLADICQSEV